MKLFALLFFGSAPLGLARADLTLVQQVEGAGPISEMTIKVKGDKIRCDMGVQMSTLLDSKTGDIVTLMHDTKTMIRISGKDAQELAEKGLKSMGLQETGTRPKLTATGKKEKIDGYETEEYTYTTPATTGSYWISNTYPDAARILKQMQQMTSPAAGQSMIGMPDYKEFPGLPLRSHLKFPNGELTTRLVSIKQDSLDDGEFQLPKGYSTMGGEN